VTAETGVQVGVAAMYRTLQRLSLPRKSQSMPRNADWRVQQAWEDDQVLIPPFDIRRFKFIDELGVNVALLCL
jgi:hypothetical protein